MPIRPAEWVPIVILRGNNPQDRMSALGQKWTSRRVRVMSALPPKADIGTQPRDVRLVPKADVELAFVLCYPCPAPTATDRLTHTSAAVARAIIAAQE